MALQRSELHCPTVGKYLDGEVARGAGRWIVACFVLTSVGPA